MNSARVQLRSLPVFITLLASACSPGAAVKKAIEGPDGWGFPDAGTDPDTDSGKPPASTDSNSCKNALDITSSIDSFYSGIATGRGSDSGSCSQPGEAGKGYYQVHISEPGNYSFYADPLAGYDDPKFEHSAMFVRTSCADRKSELACSNTGTRELNIGVTAATTLYIVVDGDVYTQAPFYLGITHGDACSSHDDCKGFASQHCNASGLCAAGGGDIGMSDGGVPDDDGGVPDAGTPCAEGTGDCNGYIGDLCETDLTSDYWNCGACGAQCTGGGSQTDTECVGGACQTSCINGYLDCDANMNNGCEVAGSYDTENCGACGNSCTHGDDTLESQCVSGSCQTSCASWALDCNGNLSDGCECYAGSNSTAACDGSACKLTCNAGYADCDGKRDNDCEVKTEYDDAHCGGCSACGQGTECVASSCKTAPTLVLPPLHDLASLVGDDEALYWLQNRGTLSSSDCGSTIIKRTYDGTVTSLDLGRCGLERIAVGDHAIYFEGYSADVGKLLKSVDKTLTTVTTIAPLPDSYWVQKYVASGDSFYVMFYDWSDRPHLYGVSNSSGAMVPVLRTDGTEVVPRDVTTHDGQLFVSDDSGILKLNAEGKLELLCSQKANVLTAMGDQLWIATGDYQKLITQTCEEVGSYQLGYVAEPGARYGDTLYFSTTTIGVGPQQQLILSVDIPSGTTIKQAKTSWSGAMVVAGPDGLYFTDTNQLMRLSY